MIESIKLMKVDFMMIKQYWKQLLMVAFIISISILPNMPLAINTILFIMGNTLIGYPFMVAEKDKMDKFYSIIAVSKKDIVRSKYLITIGLLVMMTLLLIPFNLVLYYVMGAKVSLSTILIMISLGIFLYSLVAAIQLPCYFKWGYSKSKVITLVLPLGIGGGVPFIVLVVRKFIGEQDVLQAVKSMGQFINMHYSMVIIGVLSIAILCFVISYAISNRICLIKNKE